MIVTRQNVYAVVQRLAARQELACDTETSGIRPYHGDSPFCLIIADESDEFIFDFGHWDRRWSSVDAARGLLSGHHYWYLANAKFDMAMLERHCGITLHGEIHDLMVHERILDSTLFGKVFALDKIAKRYGMVKSAAVEQYCKDHSLVTKTKVPGKKKLVEQPHYDRVPADIMAPYADQDARVTYDIGALQKEKIIASAVAAAPPLGPLALCERLLVRTVYEMEKTGVLVDLPYCRAAAEFEEQRGRRLIEEFESLAGVKYKSSAKVFTPLFAGEKLLKTKAGAPCFNAEAMATYSSPYAKLILAIRDAKSKSDYYQGFLYHADADGVVHSSFNQHQARTGRFSSSAPNLQNMTKPDEDDLAEEFTPRRAIIPRPGHFFAMFDYDQVEYRLMLEYASVYYKGPGKRPELVEQILGGLDVHAATALLAGVTRQQAKTTNFLTIYGGGDEILAKRLGRTVPEARGIREAIFRAAPEIKTFISAVVSRARERGFVYTWLGRRCFFPDPEEAYRAPNHIVQGGCADLIKMAMNEVRSYLLGGYGGAKLVLSIHDELVLECPEGKQGSISQIQDVMQRIYPSKYLPLTCGVDHSFKSLADKQKGLPT